MGNLVKLALLGLVVALGVKADESKKPDAQLELCKKRTEILRIKVRQAESEARLAEEEWDMARQLYAKAAISREEMLIRRRDVELAALRTEERQAELSSSEARDKVCEELRAAGKDLPFSFGP